MERVTVFEENGAWYFKRVNEESGEEIFRSEESYPSHDEARQAAMAMYEGEPVPIDVDFPPQQEQPDQTPSEVPQGESQDATIEAPTAEASAPPTEH